MKIFCVQDNFFIKENKSDKPVFFLKPESCIIRNRQPFFYPEFSRDIRPLPHVVVKVSRLGKAIQPLFGHLYYNEITMGLDMEAHDVMQHVKANNLPWEKAKVYDASSPLGHFISLDKTAPIDELSFRILKNGIMLAEFNLSGLVMNIPEVISYISENITLKIGDIVYAGGPNISETIEINDILECFIDNEMVLSLKIK